MKKALFLSICFLLISLAIWTAGCGGEEASPTVTLGIRNIQSCSSLNTETGEYTIQPGSTFDRGDAAWLYFEVPGITVKGVDDKFEFWVKFSELKLFNPNGDIIANISDFAEIREVDLDEPPNFVWFYAYFESTSDDPVGQYRWEFVVKDELYEATGTGSATFNLQ